MYKGNKPKIIPIIIAIVVIALVIAALVSLGRMLFTSGDKDKAATPSESQRILDDTLNTAAGRSVRFTERGPIVADENFKSYQIVVTPTTRTYTTYSGYLDRVVDVKSYQNNSRAYEEFVHALNMANISKLQNTDVGTDVRGICATNGRLYVYETANSGSATHMLWTSTCSGSRGNMGASVAQIKALFVNQIPDFDPNFFNPKKR